MTVPAPAPGARIAWLDLARAASIVLVVLYHVTTGAAEALLGPDPGPIGRAWQETSRALIPLRMPLFFLVSGILGGPALRRPWARVRRGRVLDHLWVASLWTVLYAVATGPVYAPGHRLDYLWAELRALPVAGGLYWFLVVLPLLFLLARAGIRRPRLMLGLAAAVYVLAVPGREALLLVPVLPAEAAHGFERFAQAGLWYVIGVLGRERILAATSTATETTSGGRPRSRRMLPGLAAALGFLLAAAGFLASPVDSAAALTAQALASVSGLTAVLALLPPLASGPRAAALGRYLGGRTLPIYVIHPLTVALTALDLGPLEASGGGTEGTSALGELLIVPAGTAVAIGLSLLVHALLTRWGPSWAFAAPTLPERGRAGR